MGYNHYGQLGIGNSENKSVLTKVEIEDFKQIKKEEDKNAKEEHDSIDYVGCGGNYNYIITKKCKLYSCGYGGNGVLAHNNTN